MTWSVFDVSLQSVHVEDEDSVTVSRSGHAKVLPGQQDEAEDETSRKRAAEPTVSKSLKVITSLASRGAMMEWWVPHSFLPLCGHHDRAEARRGEQRGGGGGGDDAGGGGGAA